MRASSWWAWGAAGLGLLLPGAAEACGGGGLVSSQPGSVGADAQRIVLAVHDESVGGGPTTTDVVVQIGVPSTTDDYGALLPVPSEPTLDPTPIASDELDELDDETAPRIFLRPEADGSGGCGCPMTGSDYRMKNGGGGDVRASKPVNIGPVTAVVLTGGATGVSAWLDENGFSVATESQTLIEEYSTYGVGHFIALKRNQAAAGGPSSVGVHFTMAGDHRELPLKFARLGAAAKVAFTLFIVADETAAPSPPFAALGLEDLDPATLRAGNYVSAVESAVAKENHQAFVLESRHAVQDLFTLQGTRLASLFRASTLTRLSTVLPATALTEDARFYDSYQGEVLGQRYVQSSTSSVYREASTGSLGLLLVAGAWRRKRPPRRRHPSAGVGAR